LTDTAEERRGLLRPFFEPSDEDETEGRKVPTEAHRAIAALARSGLIRVILTTNFDLLVERALREAGVEPVVASSPAEIQGLSPLHLLAPGQALVVHLHGDYLSAQMLNTADELGAYPAEVDSLLDRVLDEYGLIVAGWSARWDVALAKAVQRAANRRFATYWIDPAPLSPTAAGLVNHRAGHLITGTADDFLSRVQDAAVSLAETERRHPLTVVTAVATAKRQLAGGRVAIDLHDTLREEAERVRSSDVVNPQVWQAANNVEEHQRRRAKLEAQANLLVALVATAAYWGTTETDGWWIDLLGTLSIRPRVGGESNLINLARAPGVMLLHAAGVAAVGAGRQDVVARLLIEPTTENVFDGQVGPLAEILSPSDVFGVSSGDKHLQAYLQPIIEGRLARGSAYYDDWDRWQMLVAIAVMDARRQDRPYASARWPYVRVVESFGDPRVPIAERLGGEVEAAGSEHPLLIARFCDSDPARFQAALDDATKWLVSAARQTVAQRMTQGVVTLHGDRRYLC